MGSTVGRRSRFTEYFSAFFDFLAMKQKLCQDASDYLPRTGGREPEKQVFPAVCEAIENSQ